ncbi:MAG: hypothetical protein AAF514_22535 [Verrucomicrobiota bacterium]
MGIAHRSPIRQPRFSASLLILLVTSLGWVGCGPTESGPPTSAGSAPVVIEKTSLKRDFENVILTVEVAIDRRQRTEDLPLKSPNVRLMGAEGEIPAFFLATDESPFPVALAGKTATYSLPYWLETAHLAQPLVLEMDGVSLEVKPGPFDLEQLKNGESRSWDGPVGAK